VKCPSAETFVLLGYSRDIVTGIVNSFDCFKKRALREALLRGVFFPLMKAVDGLGILLEIFELEKEYGVEIVKIGRCTGRDIPLIKLGMNEGEIRRLAESQMAWVLEKSEPYRHLPRLYWEVVNEPAWPELERHLLLCKFFKYCMDLAEESNLKLALFSYSMGFPKIEWWPSLIGTGVFTRAKAGGHILSLHEGTAGRGFSEDGVIPWLCHRYRFLYELLSEEEVIPLAITEFTFGDVERYGKEKWVGDLVAYAKGLDPYVIGVTPFTLGPFEDFSSEDYEACLPMLVEELVRARGEKPEEGEVKFRYDCALILLPQGASWEYWEALRKFIEVYRPSILQSVHDCAAISPYARTHTVTAINPTEEFLRFLRKELDTN